MFYLIAIAVFFTVLEVVFIIHLFWYTHKDRNRKREYFPKVVILSPHYGWDDETKENALRILSQDYPGEYQVFFITHENKARGPDSSYQHLLKLAEEHPAANKVLLAKNIIDCSLPHSQKVENLLTGISHLPDDAEAIAFVDADATIRKDWLTLLVQPLRDPKVGVTSGARFYLPLSSNLATLVEATWINVQYLVRGLNWFNLVWGGSAAIRRQVLDKAEVVKRWHVAAIDDMSLTHAVKELGLKVHFVPDCLTITNTSKRSWRQILEFTNRQTIIAYRMGFKKHWALTTTIVLPKGIVLLLSISTAIWSRQLTPLLLIPCAEILSYRLSILNFPQWLKNHQALRKMRWRLALVTPISLLITSLNCVYALFQKKIFWGGVRYKIHSAVECEIMKE